MNWLNCSASSVSTITELWNLWSRLSLMRAAWRVLLSDLFVSIVHRRWNDMQWCSEVLFSNDEMLFFKIRWGIFCFYQKWLLAIDFMLSSIACRVMLVFIKTHFMWFYRQSILFFWKIYQLLKERRQVSRCWKTVLLRSQSLSYETILLTIWLNSALRVKNVSWFNFHYIACKTWYIYADVCWRVLCINRAVWRRLDEIHNDEHDRESSENLSFLS